MNSHALSIRRQKAVRQTVVSAKRHLQLRATTRCAYVSSRLSFMKRALRRFRVYASRAFLRLFLLFLATSASLHKESFPRIAIASSSSLFMRGNSAAPQRLIDCFFRRDFDALLAAPHSRHSRETLKSFSRELHAARFVNGKDRKRLTALGTDARPQHIAQLARGALH